MATRNGSAEWRGDLKGGSGELTVGERAFTGPYSFGSRFEEGEGTNPEELLAAAHAACYAMALGNILAEGDHRPERVHATARAHLRMQDDKPTIARIDLEVEVTAGDIDSEHLQRHAEEAKDGCVVSRALAGVGEINLSARLVD